MHVSLYVCVCVFLLNDGIYHGIYSAPIIQSLQLFQATIDTMHVPVTFVTSVHIPDARGKSPQIVVTLYWSKALLGLKCLIESSHNSGGQFLNMSG